MRGGWLVATALVALVAAAAFAPWIFSGKVLAPLDIVEEMLVATSSERQGRVIDKDASASMEKKKQEGYF